MLVESQQLLWTISKTNISFFF